MTAPPGTCHSPLPPFSSLPYSPYPFPALPLLFVFSLPLSLFFPLRRLRRMPRPLSSAVPPPPPFYATFLLNDVTSHLSLSSSSNLLLLILTLPPVSLPPPFSPLISHFPFPPPSPSCLPSHYLFSCPFLAPLTNSLLLSPFFTPLLLPTPLPPSSPTPAAVTCRAAHLRGSEAVLGCSCWGFQLA